jgi:hypothetical protein
VAQSGRKGLFGLCGERVGHELSVVNEAALYGFGPQLAMAVSYHFARQFKAATGLPPHRYVITRRVERA